jgi:allene oxide cyclase
MKANRKLVTVAAAAAVLVAAPVAALASTSSSGPPPPFTVHVVEHAITDTVQEFHPPNLSLGDTLGWHNPVYNASDTSQVGMDNGYCVRTVATGKTEWECAWTTLLPGGDITVEGPYYDDGTDTTLAVTGGTGIYTGADGSMLLHARGNPVGSEYDFVFSLTR